MNPSHHSLKEAILASLNIPAFYESYLKNSQRLKTTSAEGWTDRVFCPIHGDAGTPNFFCNTKNGGFKCHSCGANGSVFDFWLAMNGLSKEDKRNYSKALIAVADFAGVNIETWAKDHPGHQDSKKVSSGNSGPENFLPAVNAADANDAANSPLPSKLIESFQAALRPEHWKYLSMSRGLKKATIELRRIGWDESAPVKTESGTWVNGRYTIPVPDKGSYIRNIRLYSNLSAESKYKMLNYVANKGTPQEKRYGRPPRLLGLDRLLLENWEHVVICEGEFDCFLLDQNLKELGLTNWGVVTGTHGVTQFSPEWLEYLFNRHVYICYDCDEPSIAAANSNATKYFLGPMKAGKFLSVRIVELPLEGSKDQKDVSDYFLKASYTTEQFVQLCGETPELIAGGLDSDEATVEVLEVASFVDAVKNRKYIDQRISVPLTISGSTSRVYHAIRSYKVSRCPLLKKGDCCSEERGESIIPYGHPLFIQACMDKTDAVLYSIARIACTEGEQCSVSAISKVVMEEYYAHQVVERWRAEEDQDGRMRNSQELVQVPIYILQPPDNISIEPQSYLATGFVRTHPKTSIATLFIESMVPLEEDWKKFTLESSEHAELIRTIKNDFTVDQLISDITNGVTKIYEADDILYTVLLTFLSPTWIHFNGTLMRGWINSCIIGDSGTGKSATYVRLTDWLELGDLFSMLSGARTGLLYAIKQKAGEWHVSIGRYVQASGKIIAIDETQEAAQDELKRMAIAMDTGWLQVSQVASGGYHTQTRAMFIMNPQNSYGKAATISDFTHGCDALPQCFSPMFIRRLDIAVFTMARHNYDFYNKLVIGTEKHNTEIRLTPKLLRTLIYWAWTRSPNQIHWGQESTQKCLDKATELSGVYGHADDIPLINPQDFRNNLARLSTAFAVLDRNLTEDLTGVIVEARHVEAVSTLLDVIYSSPSCNLKQRSKMSRRKNTLVDFVKIKENFEQTIREARNSPNPKYAGANVFCQLLLLIQQLHTVQKRALAEQLGISPAWIQNRLSVLQGFDLLESTRYGCKSTRKFNLFMTDWQSDPDVAAMLEDVHQNLGRYSLARDDSLEYCGLDEAHGMNGNGNGNGGGNGSASFEHAASYENDTGIEDFSPHNDPFK